jgi:threonine dehydrogenase-like Zn-dependent dehydrogenase
VVEPPAGRADVVVDCTGRAAGFAEAMRLVRPRGTLVLKSTVAPPGAAAAAHAARESAPLHLAPLVIDEITVVGSRCGPFAPAIRAIEAGRVNLEALITANYPLEEAVAGFEHAARREALKVLLWPADGA